MSNKIKNIVIVGGGSAGWMTAAALSKVLGTKAFTIQLIEPSDIPTVSVGEATIPSILQFNHMLGIDERDFLKETKGTFKLGIQFDNWYRQGHRYMHPFGPYGLNMNGIPFHHYWLKDKLNGDEQALVNYCLEYQAAQLNKFTHPMQNSRSPLSNINYAYHFDAVLYANYLKNIAVKSGVTLINEQVQHTELNKASGDISFLTLASGEKVLGDFFIDCSGFKGLLIEQALHVGSEDWRHWLPCDTAVVAPSANDSESKPYTTSTALSAGWQWQIPLQHRIGNGYVHASSFINITSATEELEANIKGRATQDIRTLKWVNGKRRKAWQKNCVAIGLSAGFIEPLESTGLQLIQSAIARLISLFPKDHIEQATIDKYNQYTNDEINHIRDFVILHYKQTTRDDSEFWRYCKHMDIPSSLQHKIELYKAGGSIFRENNELFNEISWFSVMNGQGIVPRSYHPIVDLMPESERKKHMQSIKNAMQEAVRSMPIHRSYINKYCDIKEK